MKKKYIEQYIEKTMTSSRSSKTKEWLKELLAKTLYKYITANDIKKGFNELAEHKKIKYRAQADDLKDMELLDWILDQIDKDACYKIYYEDNKEYGRAMLYMTQRIRLMVSELSTKKNVYTPLKR